ncbi:hypothetical protein EDC01DRAFT_635506 [Geopyxis carbonaria]|nr:hypothetical protein EDC01DRAFT_635506 [Geopyxis carbonaria]
MSAPIRVLSLADLQDHQICNELVTCLSTQGFVKLVDHGLEDLVSEAFEWNNKFFHLDEAIKQKIAHPPRANPNRGWSCIGQEKSSNITDFEKGKDGAVSVFDVKESFDAGASDDPLFANKWPAETELAGFREFMETFYARCQDAHLAILHALERGLAVRDINVDLAAACLPNESELRLNYYPSIDVAAVRSGRISRISEHTDFGTVTLLFQDSVGGLEVEDQGNMGTYLPVAPGGRTEMLVNVGDSLQRVTNDYLTSVSHRVTLPVGVATEKVGDRYSIAYFAKFQRKQSLKPLEQFVDEDHEAKYPDISAFEWNQMKLQKIYG